METATCIVFTWAVFMVNGGSEFHDDKWTPLVERFNGIMKGIEDKKGEKDLIDSVMIDSIASVIAKHCNDGLIKDIDGPYGTIVPGVLTKMYTLTYPRDAFEEQLFWTLPSVECTSKIPIQGAFSSSPNGAPASPSNHLVEKLYQPTEIANPTALSQPNKNKDDFNVNQPPPTPPPPPPSKYVIVENPVGGMMLGVLKPSPFKPTPPKNTQSANGNQKKTSDIPSAPLPAAKHQSEGNVNGYGDGRPQMQNYPPLLSYEDREVGREDESEKKALASRHDDIPKQNTHQEVIPDNTYPLHGNDRNHKTAQSPTSAQTTDEEEYKRFHNTELHDKPAISHTDESHLNPYRNDNYGIPLYKSTPSTFDTSTGGEKAKSPINRDRKDTFDDKITVIKPYPYNQEGSTTGYHNEKTHDSTTDGTVSARPVIENGDRYNEDVRYGPADTVNNDGYANKPGAVKRPIDQDDLYYGSPRKEFDPHNYNHDYSSDHGKNNQKNPDDELHIPIAGLGSDNGEVNPNFKWWNNGNQPSYQQYYDDNLPHDLSKKGTHAHKGDQNPAAIISPFISADKPIEKTTMEKESTNGKQYLGEYQSFPKDKHKSPHNWEGIGGENSFVSDSDGKNRNDATSSRKDVHPVYTTDPKDTTSPVRDNEYYSGQTHFGNDKNSQSLEKPARDISSVSTNSNAHTSEDTSEYSYSDSDSGEGSPGGSGKPSDSGKTTQNTKPVDDNKETTTAPKRGPKKPVLATNDDFSDFIKRQHKQWAEQNERDKLEG